MRRCFSADDLARVIRSDKIDLLLIDYVLNDDPKSAWNGLAAVEKLREQGINVHTVLFSGWTGIIDKAACQRAGISRILAKPLSIQDLRSVLDSAGKAIRNEADT